MKDSDEFSFLKETFKSLGSQYFDTSGIIIGPGDDAGLVENNKETIRIFLKYDYQGNPAIDKLKRVSRPGLRVYTGSSSIPRVLDGLGISILCLLYTSPSPRD